MGPSFIEAGRIREIREELKKLRSEFEKLQAESVQEIERLQGIIAYQESRLSVIGHLASRDEDKRVQRLEAAIELIVQESNAMKQLKMATDALGRAVK